MGAVRAKTEAPGEERTHGLVGVDVEVWSKRVRRLVRVEVGKARVEPGQGRGLG
ncbi:hypothetical protein GCM10027203_00960 [Nonomuraea fastidiosa]